MKAFAATLIFSCMKKECMEHKDCDECSFFEDGEGCLLKKPPMYWDLNKLDERFDNMVNQIANEEEEK